VEVIDCGAWHPQPLDTPPVVLRRSGSDVQKSRVVNPWIEALDRVRIRQSDCLIDVPDACVVQTAYLERFLLPTFMSEEFQRTPWAPLLHSILVMFNYKARLVLHLFVALLTLCSF
jgi:hypothetical protein